MRSPLHVRRLTAFALACSSTAVLAAAAVQTEGSPRAWSPGELQSAQRIAEAHWGIRACGGQVTVIWDRLPAYADAKSRWGNHLGPYAAPEANYACTIILNSATDFDWRKLCTVMVHEYGHLIGHPHATDMTDVMSPYYSRIRSLPECNGDQAGDTA